LLLSDGHARMRCKRETTNLTRPLQVSIDLGAIVANALLARRLAPQSQLLACVKANAYGHGMVEVASVLESRVDALGVACLDEALDLRKAGIKVPILLLEGCFSAAELEQAQQQDCWIVIHNHRQLDEYQHQAVEPANLWLKLDTGMHRLGFEPADLPQVVNTLCAEKSSPALHLMTHFACADETHNAFTKRQIEQFSQSIGDMPYPRSLANSAAILAWPEAHAEWNRPGFMLYGVNPLDAETKATKALLPAMSMTSEVIAMRKLSRGEAVGYNHAWRAERDCRIAVIACGYGDGYPRQARNGTPVLVGGQRAQTIGHIAMDMMMVDITDLPTVEVGDPVELWGQKLSIAEVALHSGMSPYELMTRMPLRAERRYIKP
jgi:alanine racemase